MIDIKHLKGFQLNYLCTLPPIKVDKKLFQTEDWKLWTELIRHNMTRWENDYFMKKFLSQKAKTARYEKNLGKYMPMFDYSESELGKMTVLHLALYMEFLIEQQLENNFRSQNKR